MNTINCRYCRTSFPPRTDRQSYFCSRACSNKSRQKRTLKPCGYCGLEFMPPRNHGQQKFCSLHCRDKSRTTTREVNCCICGSIVVRKVNRIAKLKHSYCSPECHRQGLKTFQPSGQEHPQYSRVDVPCYQCGKIRSRHPSKIAKHSFCSAECRTKWQYESGYISGEKSPTWLGGCTDYRGPNWRRQRRLALTRDGHKCKNCGSSSQVQVHHVIPYRKFADYKQANMLKNLRTLCTSCHFKEDHKIRKEDRESISSFAGTQPPPPGDPGANPA